MTFEVVLGRTVLIANFPLADLNRPKKEQSRARVFHGMCILIARSVSQKSREMLHGFEPNKSCNDQDS
jgi:hypothetical protein